MDVDSSMVPDADHDPPAENHASAAAPAAPAEVDGEKLTESPSSGGGSPAEQQQQMPVQQQNTVVGPRLAPTYTVVNVIMDKKEDGPGPRCGHTLTAVSAVGEEGMPGYIGPRLILFGGATALEGNSAASGTPSSAGNAGIRLAGATADVHSYDVLTSKWSRLTPYGEPPTPRAAHVATAVGTMVVIQGGIGPAGLSAEDLHVLDLTQQWPRWHRVSVQGPGPGPRYGHVMALVGQIYLMAIGGNDGKRPLADVWALDTAAKPYEWRKLEPEGEGPPPCIFSMYSSASAQNYPETAYASCDSYCSDIRISYPFRMGDPKCYADKWFEIECRNTSRGSKPYLKSINLEVSYINSEGSLVYIRNPVFRWNCNRTKDAASQVVDLKGSPFVYSKDYNKFMAIGCNKIAFLQSNESKVSRCVSLYDEYDTVKNFTDLGSDGCVGRLCCETSLPSYLVEFNATLEDLAGSGGGGGCTKAMIGVESWYRGYSGGIRDLDVDYIRAELSFAVLNSSSSSNCLMAANFTSRPYAWVCDCYPGFHGNPYVDGGCIGIIPSLTLKLYSQIIHHLYDVWDKSTTHLCSGSD
ncbi:hypothetical protein OROGR_003752 [Orobanche gracilis]